MNELIKKLKNEKFIDLGFANWISGKGLQIENLDCLEKGMPGVYVMHYDDIIQKIGKSSSDLHSRLKGYARFDKLKKDQSSIKQRKAIEELNIPGLYVLALQASRIGDYILNGTNIPKFSFDAHYAEKTLKNMAKSDLKNEFKFGA